MTRIARPILLAAALATVPGPAAALQAEAGAPAAADTTAAAAVTALANEFMFTALARFPELGTRFGLPIADHAAITDNSLEAVDEWRAKEDAWLERVRSIDVESLRGRPEYVTYGFLREQLESSVQGRVCRDELWNVSQMSGWHTSYATLATMQPVGSPRLREAALERFGALAGFVDNEIEKLRVGVARGYTTPRINVERVIEQLDGMLAPPPGESPFMEMADRADDPAFAAAFETLVAEEINPALRRYRDYLAEEYLPVARTEVAVAALPDGEACYRAAIRGYTTLDLSPREVHQTGLDQMERIRAEMVAIAERSFGTSDLDALLVRFKTDPEYTYDSREAIVESVEAAIDRARAAMPDWFGILPEADVVVQPYPEYEEKSAPGASYMLPAEDGSRPGLYRINTYRPETQSVVGMESTAFHEAIPGHHLQRTIGQERADAHPITRYLGNSGFTEGWGLYAERLADEMGLFSGDLDRMGLLSNEAFRAARLVVDTGLHALGWSRQQAIDYLLANTAMSETEVANEIDRYIVWPGQATAYMIGRIEIMDLRETARRELGDAFDIEAFHDRVLEDGAVTLGMLREKIRRWIDEERAAG